MKNALLKAAGFSLLILFSGLLHAADVTDVAELKRQVSDAEKAFALTMAKRDHAAFSTFLSEESVFFSGPGVLHGKQEVAEYWKRFYEKPNAPFSWEPREIEVLASGTLAISSGPVYDASGKLIASFTSIWRLEAAHTWRIIFDKGNEVCDCTQSPVAK